MNVGMKDYKFGCDSNHYSYDCEIPQNNSLMARLFSYLYLYVSSVFNFSYVRVAFRYLYLDRLCSYLYLDSVFNYAFSYVSMLGNTFYNVFLDNDNMLVLYHNLVLLGIHVMILYSLYKLYKKYRLQVYQYLKSDSIYTKIKKLESRTKCNLEQLNYLKKELEASNSFATSQF